MGIHSSGVAHYAADETSCTSEDKPGPIRKMCGTTRHDAATCDKAGEGTRTLNIQLGRLTLYQLSYARGLFVNDSIGSRRVARNHIPLP